MEEASKFETGQKKSKKEVEKRNFTKEAEEEIKVIEKGYKDSFLKVGSTLNGLYSDVLKRKLEYGEEDTPNDLFSTIRERKRQLHFDMDNLIKGLNKVTEDIKIKTWWKMNLKDMGMASSETNNTGEIKENDFTNGEEMFASSDNNVIESFLKVESTLNGLFGDIVKRKTECLKEGIDSLNDLFGEILNRKSQLHSNMDEFRAAVIEILEKRDEIAGDVRIEVENQERNKSSDEYKQPTRSEINFDFPNSSESDHMERNKSSDEYKQPTRSEINFDFPNSSESDHMERNKSSDEYKQPTRSEINFDFPNSSESDHMVAKLDLPKGITLSLDEYMYLYTYACVYTYVYAGLERQFGKPEYLEKK